MMSTTKQQKIRIGLFVVVAGVLLSIVLVAFAGVHFWKSRTPYYIEFEDTVYGLEKGADVHFNGIRVGKVTDIALSPTDLSKVRVKIEIKDGTPIRQDAKAILQFAGLTGLKVIDLRGGSVMSPRLAAGSLIPRGETALDKLQTKALAMVDQSAEIMDKANQIASNAEQVVKNLDEITDPKKLGEIIDATRSTSANLAQLSVSMRQIVDENRASLKSSVASIELAAKRMSEMIDGNQVKAAVSDLRQASRSMKEMAREVRQRPSRLLFSKPEPDRKLP
jgi:phospholipid/cholesterol/gamma-HCH transport system substrate-binding protein